MLQGDGRYRFPENSEMLAHSTKCGKGTRQLLGNMSWSSHFRKLCDLQRFVIGLPCDPATSLLTHVTEVPTTCTFRNIYNITIHNN